MNENINALNKLKKSVDILLVSLPPWGVDTPPLGLACLSSYLGSKGIRTDIFDLNIKLYNALPEELQYLWGMNYSHLWRQPQVFKKIDQKVAHYLDPLIQLIINHSAKVIGFSLPTNCSDFVLQTILERIKREAPSKVIILGGVSISINEQRGVLRQKMQGNVDYCVNGEGEEALSNLMMFLLDGKQEDIKDIQGVLCKDNFFSSIKPVFVVDLNMLPFPTFEEFTLEDYKVPSSLAMEFSRGCIGNCSFCTFQIISPIFRTKSPAYVLKQIEFYKRKYNINHLSLCDAAINGKINVLEKISDLLIKHNLSINISALAIPRKEMREGLLDKMKKAGFYRLEYGVESGSNRVLKAMRKIFTIEQAEEALHNTYKSGIQTYVYLIVGHPGEKDEDFNQTKLFLTRNAPHITAIRSINPLCIMAGCEIFHKFEKYGIVFSSENADVNWHIPKENNTRKQREKRVYELKKMADSLRILYDEDAECIEFSKKTLEKKKSVFSRICGLLRLGEIIHSNK